MENFEGCSCFFWIFILGFITIVGPVILAIIFGYLGIRFAEKYLFPIADRKYSKK